MLTTGTRLGPYEVLAPLGAGGMGEVYKARDTRLDRTVAIKILPEALAADRQFRERFDREARAVSALDHPHICALYDVGEQDGTAFLVMPYLDGETLERRLASSGLKAQGSGLPLADALTIGVQIASALDAAHRAGIVHRDLKPGNIMLTKAGATLLDFGLAKSAAPVVATSGLSMLPTTPANLTAQGMILGTFQYMAPEQIEGLDADARTDIFAFGAVVYEMLTGKKAFEGKTRASLLGAILKDEPPPVSRVQPVAPAALDRIVSTCLAKDPDDRYQSARDLWRELTWVTSGSSDSAGARTMTPPRRSNRVAWLVVALVTSALIAIAAIALRRDVTPTASPLQFTVATPENMSFGGPAAGGTGTATQVAVSPDGRNIVFVAGAADAYQLWLRPVATLADAPIPGTEGGAFPFWQPDGRFVGFFAGGKLKKVAIAGGPPIELCDAPTGRGGTWNRDNVIVFSRSSAPTTLFRVSSAGGVPTVLTTLVDGEDAHRWPHFLPDGRHFLYTGVTGACCPPTTPGKIKIGSLDPAEPVVTLLQADSSAIYGSGHLLFARDQTLMAQPFDARARRLNGDAFPLTRRVSMEGSRYVSASVSDNGTLVYAHSGSPNPQQLTWFDRAGRVLDTLRDGAPDINLALSPDERTVALALRTGPENLDIWTIDLARGVTDRLTSDPRPEGWPVWSPTQESIVYGVGAQGLGGAPVTAQLRQRFLNRTQDEMLFEAVGTPARPCGQRQCRIAPTDWSRDGRYVLYTLTGSFPLTSDIFALPLFGDHKPFPVAQTTAIETMGAFSPDAEAPRWVAYTSDAAGQENVYVQPFPRGGGSTRISPNGGRNPRWRPDGKELFYLGLDGAMMAVLVDATGQFGIPKALFQARAILPNQMQMYVVTKDGRFLVNTRPANAPTGEPLTVVINWPATIQK